MKTKKAFLIINPASGQGDPKERYNTIIAAAKQLGWTGKAITTTPDVGAGQLAAQAVKDGYTHIIACGGDGTVMETLPAIAENNVTLGIVPLGTGNLFALNLNIPTDTTAAMQTALHGTPKPVDVAQANDIYFSVIAGIGWDAAMIRDADRELKNKLGLLAYFVAAIKNIRHPPTHYLVAIDNKPPRRFPAQSILVANLGQISGGIVAVPDAKPRSGVLKVGIIQTEDLWSWVKLCFHALTGQIDESSHYTLLQGQKVEIRSLNGPQPFECDGNDFDHTEVLTVKIIPKGISVMHPVE